MIGWLVGWLVGWWEAQSNVEHADHDAVLSERKRRFKMAVHGVDFGAVLAQQLDSLQLKKKKS
jgi:hypothetical protein